MGAGVGEGSCPAAPFRSPLEALKWPSGCPAGAECCTEFGYCRPQAEWVAGAFRDCNGVSNGMPYPSDVIKAESAAAELLLGFHSPSVQFVPSRVKRQKAEELVPQQGQD